jgi:hypothetical protein
MALDIIFSGVKGTLEFDQFISDDEVIRCKFSEDHSLVIDLNCPLKLDSRFNPNRFETVLLRKKNLVENDIFQVIKKPNDDRLGWCFPIQALCSIEHSFSDDENFLRFAYIAVRHILENLEQDYSETPDISGSENLYFSDFFPDDTAIWVTSLGADHEPKNFELVDWIPSLFGYGYAHVIGSERQAIVHEGINPEGGNLNLFSVSSDVQNLNFINNVFSNLLPYEKNPLLIFFYQYQIIELFIGQVFEDEQTFLIQKLIAAAQDSIETKKVLKKISDLTSEAKRIKLLFNDYVDYGLDRNPLLVACNNYLVSMGHDAETLMQESLYLVRNRIFHRYLDIPSGNDQLLEDICISFNHLLVQLATKYKKKAITP